MVQDETVETPEAQFYLEGRDLGPQSSDLRPVDGTLEPFLGNRVPYTMFKRPKTFSPADTEVNICIGCWHCLSWPLDGA